MPTFDYLCDCGKKEMDRLVQCSDTIVICECGKKMKKQVSAPNIGGMDEFGRSKSKEE